ncbi:hypothetical protein [Aurantiacibacter sediminis]|uniref:GDT1 family protein n=1 Tax=Aurantiacibacter sediminis TaxID=2793064 RepID=A0ABS0N1K5_9SPHN|nr:hypothetical protein [Aurantiacibacter sediminis]MBH5321838.1 hypothetical protein [Aurantiacibacter sediminis]
MTTFFLTFLAVALAMVAGREAVRAARLAGAGANPAALLAIAIICSIGACAVAAWLGNSFANLLNPEHKRWLVAAALALAAAEVAFLDAPAAPQEPTQSLGAIFIVLFAGVAADASGLLVLSLSVASDDPIYAAAGGALAVTGVLGIAIMAGSDWELLPRGILRLVIAALLFVAAIAIVLFDFIT